MSKNLQKLIAALKEEAEDLDRISYGYGYSDLRREVSGIIKDSLNNIIHKLETEESE